VIHIPCDRCQRQLEPAIDLHFTLTIELEAAGFDDEPEMSTPFEQMDDLEVLLEDCDATCSADFGEDLYQRRQYTLCKPCFQQYILNPLAKAPQAKPFGYQPG